MRALAEHGRALGRDGVNGFVDADDDAALAFAHSYGLEEVDYQLEQVRFVGAEPDAGRPGRASSSWRSRAAARSCSRRPGRSRSKGYEDLPLPGPVTYPFATWLREEATRPDGSFVAYEGDELVGYAGLMEHGNGTATAEHGLTVVRRDRRRRGIARALKLAQLRWAATAGVVELVTWTQKGNEGMQALNASLGYENRSRVLTMQGPLP